MSARGAHLCPGNFNVSVWGLRDPPALSKAIISSGGGTWLPAISLCWGLENSVVFIHKSRWVSRINRYYSAISSDPDHTPPSAKAVFTPSSVHDQSLGTANAANLIGSQRTHLMVCPELQSFSAGNQPTELPALLTVD